MEWEFELVAGPYGGTSEGPAWDGEALLFSIVYQDKIMRYEPKSGECVEWRTDTNKTIGLMFDSRGRLYGCQDGGRCIVRFEPDGVITTLPHLLDGRRHNRPNDLAIEREDLLHGSGKATGRIWFSDPIGRFPIDREIDHASVLRLDPQPDGDWTLKRMTYDTVVPSGVLLSQDERTLYVSEMNPNGPRELRAYPIREDDTLGPYIVLYTFGQDYRGAHRGLDGMCLDTDGNIIACAGSRVAGPGPMVYVFSPSGRILETHPLPVDQTTNCTFGDPDLGTLYVTTGGGHLFRVRNTRRRGWLVYPR